MQKFCCGCTVCLQIQQLFMAWNKSYLPAKAYIYLDSSQYVILFSQSLIGRSEACLNILEKFRLGGLRRIWKTLIGTVAMNQVNVLNVITIPLSWPEWFRSCFVTPCKIFWIFFRNILNILFLQMSYLCSDLIF